MDAQSSREGEYIEQTNHSNPSINRKPPSKGVVLITTGVAFSKGMKKCGLEGIARNWKGRIQKAWAKSAEKSSEPLLVEEAAAIKMGMVMAQKAQWKAVEFQSDCKDIVDLIRDENAKESRVSVFQKMKGLFNQCTFFFC